MAGAWQDRWPVVARHGLAAEWLQIWADLGRAPRTIDAYARGLAEYLESCERAGIDPVAATRGQVAVFVRELTGRPSRRGANVLSIDSGAGLANATLQQRLVPVRLFYDFLVEEGCVSPTRSAVVVTRPRRCRRRRPSAWLDSPADQAAVDSHRIAMAVAAGGGRRVSRPATG